MKNNLNTITHCRTKNDDLNVEEGKKKEGGDVNDDLNVEEGKKSKFSSIIAEDYIYVYIYGIYVYICMYIIDFLTKEK